MQANEMTQRTFTSDDQHAFAKVSGDSNPVHMDPVQARRLLFGLQIVHGLHALLWGLDHFWKDHSRPLALHTVKVNFQTAIGLGQSVRCRYESHADDRVEIQLEVDNTPAVWAQIAWNSLPQPPPDDLPIAAHVAPKCRERSPDVASGAAGGISLFYDGKLGAGLFPNLNRVLSALQLAALLSTTRLVGMECPGLHSIFAGLNLTFDSDRTADPQLNYRVTDCNRRLGLCLMNVDAPGMEGQVKAFFRPKPQKQAPFTDACGEVETGEFSAQRALIIGGSRGLGEVTAKLLAAGGAEITITYCHGEQDAQRVVAEIGSHGGRANCLALDVLNPPRGFANMAAHDTRPLYLYYFATPFIFGAQKGQFSARRFSTFSDFYVDGFLQTVQALMASSAGLQKILYPSSAAIDELPLEMGEYAAAKMAGEVLCDFLQKANPGLTIYKPRLPRIATDQTVSLLPVRNQDPLAIMLDHLRFLGQM
jgi:NADP-dependent 3-hydroxy acid dehydrogenase YdfG